MSERYGARVVNLPDKTILIEQTKFNPGKGRYTIDHYAGTDDKIERHVRRDDDAAIGAAVRLALSGELTKS